MKKWAKLVTICAVASAVLLAGCGPPKADAEKLTAALEAVSRLESKVEAGVVYADYSKAVGDTKGTVDLFTESAAAKSYPKVAAGLSRAMRAYVMAGTFWKWQIESAGSGSVSASAFPSWPANLKEFPELRAAVDQDGHLSLGGASQALWSAANESLTTAKAAAPK